MGHAGLWQAVCPTFAPRRAGCPHGAEEPVALVQPRVYGIPPSVAERYAATSPEAHRTSVPGRPSGPRGRVTLRVTPEDHGHLRCAPAELRLRLGLVPLPRQDKRMRMGTGGAQRRHGTAATLGADSKTTGPRSTRRRNGRNQAAASTSTSTSATRTHARRAADEDAAVAPRVRLVPAYNALLGKRTAGSWR